MSVLKLHNISKDKINPKEKQPLFLSSKRWFDCILDCQRNENFTANLASILAQNTRNFLPMYFDAFLKGLIHLHMSSSMILS